MALAGLAACGGAEKAGCTEDVKGTAGTRLVFEAEGEPADVEATADRICKRLDGFGDERPAVAVEGDRITVVVPEGSPQAAVDLAGAPGRLLFYDWEPVLLDEKCKRDPNRNSLDRSPVVGRERADELARKCGDGARVVRQERTAPAAPRPDVWWIVRGEPVLGAEDIVNPEQNVDPGTNEPIVTMEFSPEGIQRFTAFTRTVAERGADNALPGVSPQQAAHHFAIVLDDELVSTPFIDYAENPDGIDGRDGVQIAGGFTIESARLLARILELGPLPVDLVLVERRTQGG